VIDDSEEPVRRALAKLRQKVFEKALQMKTDAASAAFPPRNRKGEKTAFRNKGRQVVGHETVNGHVRLSRTGWWSADHGCDERIDRLIGLAAEKVSESGKEFAGELLQLAKHEGVAALLSEIESARKSLGGVRKRKALAGVLNYVGSRAGMCDCPGFLEKGWQIGSGPTEAMCKVLTYRLKGAGMRWDRVGAESIMALIALDQSNTWKSYWDSQKQAA